MIVNETLLIRWSAECCCVCTTSAPPDSVMCVTPTQAWYFILSHRCKSHHTLPADLCNKKLFGDYGFRVKEWFLHYSPEETVNCIPGRNSGVQDEQMEKCKSARMKNDSGKNKKVAPKKKKHETEKKRKAIAGNQ